MNGKIRNGIKIIVFIGIFIILFYGIGVVLNPSGTREEWLQSYSVLEFYTQEENTLDIIFVGNSSIYTGVSPLEIYDKIGVTGYSLSTPVQKPWASYYWMKEALDYQKPKVFFVEIGEAFSSKKQNGELSTRRAIDSMKFGKNKLEMVMDSDFQLSNFDKISSLFPILRYHSRWSKLNEPDFEKLTEEEQYTYKGYFANKDRREYKGNFDKKAKEKYKKQLEEGSAQEVIDISQESRKKMDKMIELCKEHNCELVLIKIPEPLYWGPEKNKAITDYANSKNIKFIDLNYEEAINIDWKTDTQDGGDHLNINGAKKIGQYLSEYIKQSWNLEDHRNDENYQEWNEMLKKYKDIK